MLVDREVAERVERLELSFNSSGLDPYGISKWHLGVAFSALKLLYRRYFRVRVHGIENVPRRGRAMLIGNHSGGIAIDAAMVLAAVFFEGDPPRLAQGMVEKFINRQPMASLWASRTGQFTGVPELASRLLTDDRLLMVFPEGARGTAKLWKERYSLVAFGTGFMRLALKAGAPIVPLSVVGGADAFPTVANLYRVGRLLGVPYIPLTPYLLPVPLPVDIEIHFGSPMTFTGNGNEDDQLVEGYVEQVKRKIGELTEEARATRRKSVGSRPSS